MLTCISITCGIMHFLLFLVWVGWHVLYSREVFIFFSATKIIGYSILCRNNMFYVENLHIWYLNYMQHNVYPDDEIKIIKLLLIKLININVNVTKICIRFIIEYLIVWYIWAHKYAVNEAEVQHETQTIHMSLCSKVSIDMIWKLSFFATVIYSEKSIYFQLQFVCF